MKTNTPNVAPRTAEGALAAYITPEQELRRSVLSCMLFEDGFYENGVSVADRIATLVEKVEPAKVAALAIEAREKMKLRHVPLWLVRHMARLPKHKAYVAETLARVIQRADELAEFCSLYWLEKKQPLSAQVKKGLAKAFPRFSEYALSKYDRAGKVRLRDVLFLTHPVPKDAAQAATWKLLADDKLPPAATWEVALSSGADKKTTWETMLRDGTLGALAILRNLRNMAQVNVDEALIINALENLHTERILPFRFIAAAKAAPQYEAAIDKAMLKALAQQPKLPGKTIVIIDVSGSMYGKPLSEKSDMDRALAACALGALTRELCENARIYATAGNDWKRIHQTELVPARHGMALVDAIYAMCHPLGGGGIFLNQVCKFITEKEHTADRTIVITDEQDCANASVDSPGNAVPLGKGYLINVNTNQHGIAYKPKWTHLDGLSEAVFDYIQAVETEPTLQ